MKDLVSTGHVAVSHIFVKTPYCGTTLKLMVSYRECTVSERTCEACGRMWKIGASPNREGTFDVVWRMQRGARREA